MRKICRIIQPFLLCLIFLSGIVSAQTPETITEKQRDTILLMTARENANYDICLVMDISDSVSGQLDRLKEQAAKVVDFAVKDDTLIFIKFDDSPRKPLIQNIRDSRDVDLFKGWINKTVTTKGFGTDILAAYYEALDALHQLNEIRKKNGQPVRIQYIVFVSDGDDIPPAYSPFRNPASEKSRRLEELIKQAKTQRLINIIPVGMEFDDYLPKYVRYNPDHIPAPLTVSDPKMREFMEHLRLVLQRQPVYSLGSDEIKVPLEPYKFYIDWLSGKLSITRVGPIECQEKNCIKYRYRIRSDFKTLNVENLSASTVYSDSGSSLKGEAVETRTDSMSIPPGGSSNVDVTIKYPLNWGFKKVKSRGTINLHITGEMKVAAENRPVPGASPSPSPTPSGGSSVYFNYPFNELSKSDSVEAEIPTTRALYLYSGLGLLGLVLFPLFLLYQVAVPITITLKTQGKARAFNLSHGGRITIGGNSDFELEGCSTQAAEIQRRYRRFVLVEKTPGTIPDNYKSLNGQVILKLGSGFSLVIDGSYREFEFLPGNREYSDDENPYSQEINPEDLEGDIGEFKF